MKELNKKEIYSLEGLSDEQLKVLADITGINLVYLKLSKMIEFFMDKWCYSDKLDSITAKAIDLFDEEKKSDFKTITDSIASLLEYKNEKYGNAALEPLNIFANKTQVGQRIDDKLARIKNSDELRKNDVADLIGYLLLECKFRGWNNFDEFKD